MKSGAIKLTSTSDEGTTGNFEVEVLEGRAACGGRGGCSVKIKTKMKKCIFEN